MNHERENGKKNTREIVVLDDNKKYLCTWNGIFDFTKNSLNHPYGGHGYCGKMSTVYKSCTSSSCGVSSYKSCRDNDCGVERYKLCRHSQCGVEEYNTCYHYRPCDEYS